MSRKFHFLYHAQFDLILFRKVQIKWMLKPSLVSRCLYEQKYHI